MADRGLQWNRLAEDAGMSVAGLRRLREREVEPRDSTKRRLETALGYEDGSIDLVMAGHSADVRVLVELKALRRHPKPFLTLHLEVPITEDQADLVLTPASRDILSDFAVGQVKLFLRAANQ